MRADLAFSEWLESTFERHVARFKPAELTRALRALSASYVERRGQLVAGVPETDGKRAAFAAFYGPLHWLTVREVVRALAAAASPLETLVDLGCGTGAAGAAWALEFARPPRLMGIDRSAWALAEARVTYERVGLHGRTRRQDAVRLPRPRPGEAMVAAYLLNELDPRDRETLCEGLLEAADRGCPVLVIEPVARAAAPWWDGWARRAGASGGRADEWRFRIELPARIAALDRAAGMDHRELTARSVWIAGRRRI